MPQLPSCAGDRRLRPRTANPEARASVGAPEKKRSVNMSMTMKLFADAVTQVAQRAEARGIAVFGHAHTWAAAAALIAACGAMDARAQAGEIGPTEPQQEASSPVASQPMGERTLAHPFGTAVGAIVGATVTQGASRLTRVLGVLVGASAGAAVAEGAGRRQGEGSDATSDEATAPPFVTTTQRDGRGRSVVLSRAAYEAAVARASAPAPDRPRSGWRQLDASTHQGLWSMALDLAAHRSVASAVGRDLDRAVLAHAVSPGDQALALRSREAKAAYAAVFSRYTQSYQSFWNVMQLAERSKFDVSAQRTVVSVIPDDVSQPVMALHWPGLEERIRQVHERSSLAVAPRGDVIHAAARPRAR